MNEVSALKERGATLVLIGRTVALSDDPNPSEAVMRPLIQWFLEHTSESLVKISTLDSVPDGGRIFDWFVRNDGDLAQLLESARTLTSTQRL